MSSPNQTKLGIEYHQCNDSVKQKSIFGLACLGKNLGFHTEMLESREKGILKIGLFHRDKELSKSNQTRYAVSPVKWERKIKKNWYTLSGKKLVFHTELFKFREKGNLNKGIFHRVKELSESKQTRYGVSPA